MSYFIIYLYFITQCIKITHTNQNITIRVIKNIVGVKRDYDKKNERTYERE